MWTKTEMLILMATFPFSYLHWEISRWIWKSMGKKWLRMNIWNIAWPWKRMILKQLKATTNADFVWENISKDESVSLLIGQLQGMAIDAHVFSDSNHAQDCLLQNSSIQISIAFINNYTTRFFADRSCLLGKNVNLYSSGLS